MNRLEALHIQELFPRNLLFLINSMVFSEFGNVIYNIAINFWILDITHSTILMGWLTFISIIPRLVIAPFISVYVNRHNNKTIIVFMDVIRGTGMCLFGIITMLRIDNVIVIIANSILLAVSNCFYQTSINASAVYIFPKDKFMESNSIVNFLINLSEVYAAAVSGILLSIFSAPILFIINGMTFFISAISGLFLRIPVESKGETQGNMKGELLSCIRLIKDTKPLMNLVLIRCLLGMLFQINIILIIPLFNFKYTKILYGFSNSVGIMGALAGGICLIYLKKYLSNNQVMILSIISLAASFILISNTNTTYLLFAAMFLFGLAFNIYNILIESSIVLLIPKEHRDKALSIIFKVVFFFIGIGSLIGGIIGDQVSIPIILTVNSIMILLFSVFFYIIDASSKLKMAKISYEEQV